MPRRKLNYSEGTWFAVPLNSGGFGIGLAARIDGGGRVLGYFFGKRMESPVALAALPDWSADDAVYITHLGDLGLLEGKWPIIGRDLAWKPENWPVPLFGRIDIMKPSRATLVEYNERLERIKETPVPADKVKELPEDGLDGAEAAERMLDHLITNNLTFAAFRKRQRKLMK